MIAAVRLLGCVTRDFCRRRKLIDPRPRFVCAYDYTDEGGKLLFQVIRYTPKRFSQRRPGEGGSWINNLDGVRRVLYRLPETIEAVSNDYGICLGEGEKDADTMRANNIPATTCPGGAGKWRDEYNEFLRGADVILLPHNDKAGRDHFERVARALDGTAKSIRILDLAKVWSECPDKGGDVSDWFNAGGTAERLWELIDATPLWSPATKEQPAPSSEAGKIEPWREGMITARDLCSKEFPELKFLVPGIIPEGLPLGPGGPRSGKAGSCICSA
jgi:putative DNA primase/helicase